MADVQRSPFDLRSWQGLTAVLKAARESSLSPLAYAAFRNLVLEYAQKGGDTELKKQIDAVIVTFGAPHEKKAPEELEADSKAKATSSDTHNHAGGRRITPVFGTSTVSRETQSLSPDTAPPLVSIGKEDVVPESMSVPQETIPVSPSIPSPIVEPPRVPESFKSLEEYRTRIMEIKRRVNTLVGNPVTLLDKGNGIGRIYMTALLTAMKATSPGSTLDSEDAMQQLNSAYNEILAFANTHKGTSEVDSTKESAHVERVVIDALPPIPPIPPMPTSERSVPVSVEIKDGTPEVPTPVGFVTPPDEKMVSLPHRATVVPEREPESIKHDEPADLPHQSLIQDVVQDEPWLVDDQAETRRAVQEAVTTIAQNHVSSPGVDRGRRSFIPSLVGIEEGETHTPHQSVTDAWHAHAVPDELSTTSVMRRPESPMTGITLGTPQSELMAPDVTAALVELLHEWNIFASSGLFGMGPGGIEHPVYQQIAHLTMNEVLAGRWDNVNPKMAHAIKDYVDSWRHEQAIAYNPTETFEHYLRRVTQRIMKRQNGERIEL